MRNRICAYERCDKPATELACGRYAGHTQPAYYCDEHASEVVEEDTPEYAVNCPNCDCRFGVD